MMRSKPLQKAAALVQASRNRPWKESLLERLESDLENLLTEWHRGTTSYRSEAGHGIDEEVPFCGVGEDPEVISHGWFPSRDRARGFILVPVVPMTVDLGLVFVACDGGGRVSHLEVDVGAWFAVGNADEKTINNL